MAYTSLKSAEEAGSRAEQLQVLAAILAANIDECDDPRVLPQLARQYRETKRELAGIMPDDSADEMGELLGGIDKVR